MSSTSNSKSSESVTSDKGYNRKIIVTIECSPMEKYPIYQREGTETHGDKPHYERSENPHIEISHSEKDIQVYKYKE